MGKLTHLTLLCTLAGALAQAPVERDIGIQVDPSDRVDRLANEEVCWEQCFQVEDTQFERFREVYDDFYRMGMEARRLKNIFSINGTALLLDSTLAEYHATNANLDKDDKAANLWQFQKNVASIVTFLTGSDNDHNPFYLEQFNEYSAFSCDEFHCLDACEVDKIINGGPPGAASIDDELENIQTNGTSHRRGNVEAACAQAKRYMEGTTGCGAVVKNEMAIGFFNSDIWSRLDRDRRHSSSSSSSSSEEHMPGPCYAHFNTRYAIGTHAAGWDEIEEFSTSAAHGFYIHDNEYTMAAAQELRNCISFRCCPTQVGDPPAAVTWWNPTIAGTSCKVTTGKYGATDAAFANHDALSD